MGRTRLPPAKCQNAFPCGGCVPNPPDDCKFPPRNYCGRPCQEIAICAYFCKKLNCESYRTAKALFRQRRQIDRAAKPVVEEGGEWKENPEE